MAQHTHQCKYLGNDAWNCGHIDNSEEPCDCECCFRERQELEDER